MIDTDGLRWSDTIPAGDDLVKETANRLLQNNFQHALVMQARQECAPQCLLLGRVIAFDKDELKLLRPPHHALKLVEDAIDVCMGPLLDLAWHSISPALTESAGL
jgi:hypothetical protein